MQECVNLYHQSCHAGREQYHANTDVFEAMTGEAMPSDAPLLLRFIILSERVRWYQYHYLFSVFPPPLYDACARSPKITFSN